MGISIISLGNFDVQLGNTTGALYTNFFPQDALLIKVTADNTDTAAHLVTFYRNSVGNISGDTPASQLVGNLAIAGNATITLPFSGQSLSTGQSLDGFADTNGNVTVSATYAIVG